MKTETYQFIVALFEAYEQSSDGREPENLAELRRAWADLNRSQIKA